MNEREDIGNRIKLAREMRKLTLKSLAAMIPGFGPSRISNYEKARRMPDISAFQKLAKALEVDVNYFYGKVDINGLPIGEITADERELLNFYRKSNDKGKSTILSVAEMSSGDYQDAANDKKNSSSQKATG